MKKRMLAWALLVCMLATLLPVSAYAEDKAAEEPTAPAGADAPGGPQTDPVGEAISLPQTDEDGGQLIAAPTDDPVALRAAQEDTEESTIVASGTCGDNLTWELDDEGTLIISGTGAMASYGQSWNNAPWYSQRSSIKHVEIGAGVTSIGQYAFYACSNLASVTIPASVTSIGYSAFYYCAKLTSVTIPEGVTSIGSAAFSECSGLTSITIPASVTSIGSSIFYNCVGLKTAGPIGGGYDYEFGWSTMIPAYAFGNCRSLTSITLPAGVTSIGNNAFYYCNSLTSITLPASVTSIGSYAFYYCSSLTGITIPEGVTSIGSYAFYYCSSLTEITIPDGVTSIGSYAFSNCYSLTGITIPEGVTSIGNNTFYYCSSLTEITIPSGVTSIGYDAFYNCTSLTSVTILSSVTSISYNVFSRCTNLKTAGPIGGGYSIEFGWTTAIPAYAFYDCDSLTSITIPSSVTSIGSYALYDCDSLTSITIPSGVTMLDHHCFAYCDELQFLTLPKSVVTIGNYAFNGCGNLVNVTYDGTVRERDELTDNGWSVIGNDPLYSASWTYGTPTVTRTIYSFADLRSLVENYDGSDTYVYYNGRDTFTIEESIVLPANLFFCADADGSTVRIPAGITLTVSSKTINAFYVENLVVEGKMTAYRRATVYRTLTGDVNWLRDVMASGACGDELTWTLYDTGELVIGGSGWMDYYWEESAPWYEWRGYIKTLTIGADVKHIYTVAFSRCLNLTGITVEPGNGTYTAEDGVLFNLDKTTLLYFPHGRGGSYTVPEGVKRIEEGSFSGSRKLSAVTLSDSVTDIAYNAFRNCNGLISVTLSANLTELGSSAFSGCSKLKSIAIPAGITSIEGYTFHDCTSLTQVILPDGLTRIDNDAFRDCSSLTSIAIPEGFTFIGYQAFRYCSALRRIVLPASLAGIGDYAFFGCYNLSSVYYGGPERRRTELTDNGWSIRYNDALYNASWEYGTATVSRTIYSFADLKAIVNNFDGSDTYVYYNGTDIFTFEESITLPETLFFCADAEGSTVRVPRGVTLTVLSPVVNAFYVENLVVEGSMSAYRRALVYRSLQGEVELLWAPIWSGTCGAQGDNLTWTLYEDGSLVISGTGGMEDFGGSAPWSEKHDMICTVVVEAGVTSIGQNAFEWCSNLTSVSLPEGLNYIGGYAFNGCSSLTGIDLPEGLTTIYYDTFAHCSSLTSIRIPASVQQVYSSAFNGCSSLTEISVAAENERLSSRYGVLFDKTQQRLLRFPGGRGGSYVVPDGVTSIESNAFEGCSGLTEIVLPDGLTGIGDSAFRDCSGLTGIALPDSLTSIEYGAFRGCSGLTSIDLPDGITSLEEGIFAYCTALTSVKLPENLVILGRDSRTGVFYNCSSLTSITIPDGVTTIGWGSFEGCSSLAGITLPESLCYIQGSAFYNCNALLDVYYGGSASQRRNLIGSGGWNTSYNSALFNATWHYGIATTQHTIHSFAELRELAESYDGGEVYVYYNDASPFVFEESITLPEKLFFCADADGSVVRVPAGVSLTVEARTYGGFYVETLVVEGEMNARRSAVYYRSLTGEIHWLPDAVASGYCGAHVTWTLFDDGELVISGTGRMNDYDYSGFLPWNNRKGEIQRVTVEAGVTHIGGAAFDDCSNLTEITLPYGLTSIGSWAFSYCGSLTEITLPDSLTSIGSDAFYRCSSLAEITLPDSLTSIGEYAFFGCGSLAEITLPDGLTSIGGWAFYGCGSLTSITIPAGVTSIGEAAFSWCEAMTEIRVAERNPAYCAVDGILYDKAQTELLGCPAGKSGAVTIPATVTKINYRALSGCSGLTGVTLPDGVTSIGDFAFLGCSGLKELRLSAGLTSIGQYAFTNCGSLTSVELPAAVREIGEWAFDRCGALTEIRVAEDNTSYSSESGVLYNKDRTELLRCPAGKSGAFTVPASVTTIHRSAFSDCGGLTGIELPAGLNSIGYTAFAGCSGLTSITIPSGVTTIGDFAFSGCSGLVNVVLSSDLTEILRYTFSGCTALTTITIPASVSRIGEYAFSNCSSLTDVYYGGTAQQKESIDCFTPGYMGYEGNGALRNATWHCTVASGSCGDDLQWTLDDASVLSIAGSGAMTDYGTSSAPGWSGLDVRTVVIEAGVTGIGSGAFRNCGTLTSITIPVSVTQIGANAFSGCTALADVIYGGTELQKSRLTGSGWSTQGNDPLFSATWQCEPLEEGWDYCGDMVYWKLDTGTRTLSIKGEGDIWDMTADTIPWRDNISRVYYVEIEEGVTGIGAQTFLDAGNLRRVTLPVSLQRIGVSAFSGCYKLTGIVFPAGVTSIGRSAFANCINLKEIVFEGEPPIIAMDSFTGVTATAHTYCTGGWWEEDCMDYGGTLTWVMDHDWEETSYVFDYVGLTVTGNRACRRDPAHSVNETVALMVKSLIMPDESTDGEYVLESAAFESEALEQQTLSFRLPALGTLSVLDLPEQLTAIEAEAFAGADCEAVLLPAGVKSIGSRAFENCAKLRYVYFPAGIEIAPDAFEGCEDLLLIRTN